MPGRASARRERSTLRVVPLVLAALALFGCRELEEPEDGYLIVENILSPVRIKTRDLEGAGWLKAYSPSRAWELIHSSPRGSFLYDLSLIHISEPTRLQV